MGRGSSKGSGVLPLFIGILVGAALGAGGTCFAIGSGAIDTGDARFQQLFGNRRADGGGISSDMNLEWPVVELHGAIPEPEIDAQPSVVSTSEGAASIVYDNVPVSDVMDYAETLRDEGYVFAQSEAQSKGGYSYSARNSEDVMEGATVVVSRELDGRFCIIYSDAPNRR